MKNLETSFGCTKEMMSHKIETMKDSRYLNTLHNLGQYLQGVTNTHQ